MRVSVVILLRGVAVARGTNATVKSVIDPRSARLLLLLLFLLLQVHHRVILLVLLVLVLLLLLLLLLLKHVL